MTTPQQEHSFEEIRKTLGDYSAIIRRRWRLGLLALGIVTSTAFWYSQYLPREYSAATTFERADDVVLQNLIQSNSPYSFVHLKSTLTNDMIGTRAIANAAVRLGIVDDPAMQSSGALSDREQEIVDRELGSYDMTPYVRLSSSSASRDTIILRVNANDPSIARNFVTTLRDQYIDDTQIRITEILQQTKGYFESEIDRLTGKVTRINTTLEARVSEFPGVNLADLEGAADRLADMLSEKQRLDERYAGLKAEIDAREGFLRTGAEAFASEAAEKQAAEASGTPTSPSFRERSTTELSLATQIKKLRSEIDDLLVVRRMLPAHPEVAARQDKLDILEQTLADVEAEEARRDALARQQAGVPIITQNPTSVSPHWVGQRLRVEMELDALRKQAAATKLDLELATQQTAQFEEFFQRIVSQEDDFRHAMDERDEHLATINDWRQHLMTLNRVLAAQNEERGTQFVLIEEPKAIVRPVKPRVSSIFAISIALGLAAAAFAITLSELLDNSFRNAAQVARAINIPVLESIGIIDTPRESQRRMKSRLAWAPAISLAMLALITTGSLAYVSLNDPELHKKALGRVGRAISAVGLTGPPTPVDATRP